MSTAQDRLDALADDLAGVRYYADDITELIGAEAHEALGRDQPIPARLALADLEAGDPRAQLAAVVDLFLTGGTVPAVRIDAALPRTGAAGLLALGLAEVGLPEALDEGEDDDAAVTVRAAVDLRPHASDADAELWVASDLSAYQRPGMLRTDHVLGIGQASRTLAQTTARRPVRRALDVGTGCGIQTFHLLSHAEHVVATDVSERALDFARFNLLLNHRALGIDPANLSARVDLRLGSLLEPVAGQTFDLIVSNPPFVITPRREGEREEERYTYRDGGLPGDTLVAHLVSELPAYLNDGGTAQMLANWEVRREAQAWSDGPAAWLATGAAAECQVEAWFIQRDTETPQQYAEVWLRDAAEGRDARHYERQYRAYLEDFASRDVAEIGFGMVWLRRPSGEGRAVGRRFEEITHPIEQPLGPHLAAAIAAADTLPGDLGSVHAVVADDVTEERHQRPGAEHPGVILLRQGAGLRRTHLLTTAEAGLVSACDGELTLGQIADAIDALLGEDDPEAKTRLLEGARRLIVNGFLTLVR
ncbi:methylase of polypeptide subunit release factors [Zhihengliuella flava]|uniref:Methylase of polypeptide subunit release factors n=1 Tax=Zhihengliuella flava TaxID=1285193 RepID=A0A931D835_9MICC|nr:methylase of polypeptide subunit release factors [Zhihengliuella flava]